VTVRNDRPPGAPVQLQRRSSFLTAGFSTKHIPGCHSLTSRSSKTTDSPVGRAEDMFKPQQRVSDPGLGLLLRLFYGADRSIRGYFRNTPSIYLTKTT